MIVDEIELNETERALLGILDIHSQSPRYPDWTEKKGEAALQLVTLLLDRNGIPEVRRAYFSDPAYNTGRGKGSQYDAFVQKGNTFASTIRHPHFLPYLRHFIFGARMSNNLKTHFLQAVEGCGGVSSGDLELLVREAKGLFRRSGMDKRDFREEIYKLALDCELEEYEARHIQKYV
ncbi:MAG: hypothetical protein JKY93_12200 [Gammaproteobacteria bacterium]|nr:hypothetical protein [Gammaproteobacteria bacterium]